MSGHSKWHSIRHKKAIVDAKKGKMFNKIIRELITAARIGGGDPEANPRLRIAIQHAKSVNMPSENIERAIKRGTGELEGVKYEEAVYEGYGPGGTAIMVTSLTDNKKRTTSELRTIFSKNGGNLGENGCVSWMFHRKGVIIIDKNQIDEEKLFNIVVEAGANDISSDEKNYEITVDPDKFENVKNALINNNIKIESAEISMVPQTYVKVADMKEAQQIAKLLMALEDHDDVQQVYSNADIPDEAFEGL
jgi:YebC/PmpR family DNA-binding regulatory protein